MAQSTVLHPLNWRQTHEAVRSIICNHVIWVSEIAPSIQHLIA